MGGRAENEEGTKNDSVHRGRCSAGHIIGWCGWLCHLVYLGVVCVDAVRRVQ
jgi:hypothetical protein